MLIIKNGDVLKATESIICHQVNPDGVMGGGLAFAIARRYPQCEYEYKEYCDFYNYDYGNLKGTCLLVKINEKQLIANCFSQDPNFNTDYKALRKIFESLLEICGVNKDTIAIPYNYGCGIANGKWDKVTKILEELSNKYKVDINIYKLED